MPASPSELIFTHSLRGKVHSKESRTLTERQRINASHIERVFVRSQRIRMVDGFRLFFFECHVEKTSTD